MLLCSTLTALFYFLLSTVLPSLPSMPFLILEYVAPTCFIWPRINKDVGFWASTCLDCQETKVARHVCPLVHHIDVPSL